MSFGKIEYCKDEIKGDCEELLNEFQQTESVRYETFCNIWKEKKFSDIFCGPMESNERRAFSRFIMTTAYSYFLPPFTFQIRVGGLYLLYGLYHSQPCTPKEKIRLALKDWQEVKKFEQEAANAQHFDAVYILRQLLSQKAFFFTAMPVVLNYRVKKIFKKQMVCEDFLEHASRPQELISLELLEEVANVHEQYEKLKASITDQSGEPDPSLNLINKDLVPELHASVMGYYNWQTQKDSSEGGNGGDRGDEDCGEGASTQKECSRRAELLASIKSKSYGHVFEASKARRHRQVELKVAGEDTGHETNRRTRARKLSLKERTKKNMSVKGHMMTETTTATKLWKLSAPEAEPKKKPKKLYKFSWK